MLDVAGFTRLMESDEAGTLTRVLDMMRETVQPAIVREGGRLVKSMGDGVLAEFPSATAALDCAIAIQRALAADPLEVRIGINLGEVIEEDGDIYGEGVNLAARIEALARPGGIAVSRVVRDQAGRHAAYRFGAPERHRVHNVAEPVEVYHLESDGVAAAAPRGGRLRARRAVVLAAACVALLAAGSLVLLRDRLATAVSGPGAAAAARLDAKPSVAVLPFRNLSGDPAQEYFSDGLTDNLISDLSRVSGLLVIARNTTFSFRERGETVDAVHAGQELGVHYVVEGSVQRAGGEVRVSASLVDAETGFQLWSAKLDRATDDIFALQDGVASEIIGALEVEMSAEERRRIAKRYTDSYAAYDLYLRAYEQYWQFNDASFKTARRLLNEALKLDPDFALARSLLATTYTTRNGAALSGGRTELDLAYRQASAAVELDPDLPQVYSALGLIHMFRREYEAAEANFDRAIELDPNFADAYGMRGWNATYAGDPERGLAYFEVAFRLNPRPPFPYINAMAEVQFALGDYAESIRLNREALRRNPAAQRARLFLGAALALEGRIEDAAWEIDELRLLEPGITLGDLDDIAPYADPKDLAPLVEGARLAGLD